MQKGNDEKPSEEKLFQKLQRKFDKECDKEELQFARENFVKKLIQTGRKCAKKIPSELKKKYAHTHEYRGICRTCGEMSQTPSKSEAQVREETLRMVLDCWKQNTPLGFHSWLLIKLKEVGKE